MYSHVFSFTFAEAVPQSKRMQFLGELFLVPEQIGARATDIYWCKVGFDGAVEFYSNSLAVTDAIEAQLQKTAAPEFLTLKSPGIGSALCFLKRIMSGFFMSIVNAFTRNKTR